MTCKKKYDIMCGYSSFETHVINKDELHPVYCTCSGTNHKERARRIADLLNFDDQLSEGVRNVICRREITTSDPDYTAPVVGPVDVPPPDGKVTGHIRPPTFTELYGGPAGHNIELDPEVRKCVGGMSRQLEVWKKLYGSITQPVPGTVPTFQGSPIEYVSWEMPTDDQVLSGYGGPGWYFWDEKPFAHGPYATEQAAQTALAEYAKTLDRD